MPKIIHLPKGSRPAKEPRTAVIYVQSRGGGSKKSDSSIHWYVLKVHIMNADRIIEDFSTLSALETIYVVGYDEAKARGGKLLRQLGLR